MKKYIGIDIGGTDIKYGLVTPKGEVVLSDKMKTPKTREGLLDAIQEIIISYGEDISGVGVSVPGIVASDGTLITAGALDTCYGMNLFEAIQQFYTGDLTIENDVNCAAYAELWAGAGRQYQHFLTVAIGTGIGGAIVINKQLYHGRHFMAGEFGFMLTQRSSFDDTREATLSLNGSIQSGIVDRYEAESGMSGLNGEEIFYFAEKGDEIAKKYIESFYESLAIGLFNLIFSFDPEAILIGGAVSQNKTFMETLNVRVEQLKNQHRDIKHIQLPPIIPCAFFNAAGIVGAAAQVMKVEV